MQLVTLTLYRKCTLARTQRLVADCAGLAIRGEEREERRVCTLLVHSREHACQISVKEEVSTRDTSASASAKAVENTRYEARERERWPLIPRTQLLAIRDSAECSVLNSSPLSDYSKESSTRRAWSIRSLRSQDARFRQRAQKRPRPRLCKLKLTLHSTG